LAGALTVPLAMAALVLAVAGLAKLGSPGAAARAVGLSRSAIRALAVGELGLAGWAVVDGGAASSAAMAALYAGFAVLTLRLARAGAACGCFGAEQAPASPIQSALSAALAATCAVGAVAGAHPAGWILERPAPTAAVLVMGLAGAVYATVLAYSELPQLWRSWSPA
jgi:hypothetical protein